MNRVWTLSDPGRLLPSAKKVAESCFKSDLWDFLVTQLHLRQDQSGAIANSVLSMMSAPYLKYHVPAHVLRMFEFANLHNISLSVVEQLAIWFHDAIYYPGIEGIERASADFMNALLGPMTGGDTFSSRMLFDASNAIMATSEHLLPTHKLSHSSLDFLTVMDLDLAHFSLDWDLVWSLSQDVKDEYKGIWTPQGSAKVLSAFIDNRPVYRSSVFAEFEEKAANNVKRLISELRAMGGS